MPRVPRYQQQVEDSPLRLPAAPMPQDSGLSALGSGLNSASQNVEAIALKAKQDAEDLQFSQFQAAREEKANSLFYDAGDGRDPNTVGLAHRQGDDAFRRSAAVQEEMRAWEEDNLPRLVQSPSARAKAKEWLARARNDFSRTAETYGGRGFQQAADATLESNIQQFAKTIVNAPIGEVDRLIRERVDGVPGPNGEPDSTSFFAQIQRTSLSKDQALARRSELLSKYFSLSIGTALKDPNADLDAVENLIDINAGSLGLASATFKREVSDKRAERDLTRRIGQMFDAPDSKYLKREVPPKGDPAVDAWRAANFLPIANYDDMKKEIDRAYPGKEQNRAATEALNERIKAFNVERDAKVDEVYKRMNGDYSQGNRKRSAIRKVDWDWLYLNDGEKARKLDDLIRNNEMDEARLALARINASHEARRLKASAESAAAQEQLALFNANLRDNIENRYGSMTGDELMASIVKEYPLLRGDLALAAVKMAMPEMDKADAELQAQRLGQFKLALEENPSLADGAESSPDNLASEFGLDGKARGKALAYVAQRKIAINRENGQAVDTYSKMVDDALSSMPRKSRQYREARANMMGRMYNRIGDPNAKVPTHQEMQEMISLEKVGIFKKNGWFGTSDVPPYSVSSKDLPSLYGGSVMRPNAQTTPSGQPITQGSMFGAGSLDVMPQASAPEVLPPTAPEPAVLANPTSQGPVGEPSSSGPTPSVDFSVKKVFPQASTPNDASLSTPEISSLLNGYDDYDRQIARDAFVEVIGREPTAGELLTAVRAVSAPPASNGGR